MNYKAFSKTWMLIVLIILIGGGIFVWQFLKTPEEEIEKPEASIITNKTEYGQGETIKITVRNGLDRSIWWYQVGPRIWGLERFVNNEWENLGEKIYYDLPIQEEGKDVCYTRLYERMLAELKPSSEIQKEWNQKICLFDGKEEPFEPEFIGEGTYRFIFNYGLLLETPDEDFSEILDEKIIYSKEFKIK